MLVNTLPRFNEAFSWHIGHYPTGSKTARKGPTKCYKFHRCVCVLRPRLKPGREITGPPPPAQNPAVIAKVAK